MKLTITLDDDVKGLMEYLNGPAAMSCLSDIGNKIFRPARKHGYENSQLQEMVDKTENGAEIISSLEKMFYEIIHEYGLKVE